MNFKVAPEPMEKLRLIGDDTRFEPVGDQPLTEQTVVDSRSGRTPKSLPCISEVATPSGKKPILKAMMTTACERDCYYCPFRAGRNRTNRVSFSPHEMAQITDNMQRAELIDGLFLSSGITKGSVSTQDRLIDTAEILRQKYSYRGYLHLKIMPGAEFDQIRRAMQLADRVSVNLEGPTPQRLGALAPKKDYWNELIQRIQWISQIRESDRLHTSIVTQFVVGAVGDTDLELLHISENLYTNMGLRRTYFSAFNPVPETPFDHIPATLPKREFRLYQASFLLRDYGWNVEDLLFGADMNLSLAEDPKLAWARVNLADAPVELNRASRNQLLRVPGIGPVTAEAIIKARKAGAIADISQLHRLGLRQIDRVAPFVLINGRRPSYQLSMF